MFRECGYVAIFFLYLPYIEGAHRLNEYISHYEPLNYNSAEVHQAHLKASKSVVKDNIVYLSFRAHEREFKLRLQRDLTVFNQNLEVHGSFGPIEVDSSHIYHGHLVDEPDKSSVFGSLRDGVFEGKIVSPRGSYYVEKAHHYFPHEKHSNRTFHSIIYHEDHVQDPYQFQRNEHAGGCGITDDIIQWMDGIQNSVVDDKSPPVPSQDNFNKYSREANGEYHGRHKRATRSREEVKSSCSLFIQTDPHIWKHMREGIPEHADPSKQSEVNEKTREELLALVAQHVAALNYIYSFTKFDGRSEHRNIKFEVQRIKIDDNSACRCTNAQCEINEFCTENIDVHNVLNLHSLGNHEDFCLSYVFTYRNFSGGMLGLTWMASAEGTPGGICETYKTFVETVNGVPQAIKRTLNTGIITFMNYNSRVPPQLSQLTLAHQIGHNFGSPHDYPPECRPGGPHGNYIMFASATSGDRPNHSKFSTCSIGNISNVLDAIEDNPRRNCLTASSGAFCGNKIVEPGEECDCGFDEDECMENCCYPRIIGDYMRARDSRSDIKGCQLRKGAQCSPSVGPCCRSETCSYIPLSRQQVCKVESECSESSQCNGRTAKCPYSMPKPNKSRCNNGTQLCISGECYGSICLDWNLTDCSLNSQDHPNLDKRQLCEVACRNGTDVCRSTSKFAQLVGLPSGGISLTPGSPCDNFQGYCDELLICRTIDADDPWSVNRNSFGTNLIHHVLLIHCSLLYFFK